MSAAASDEARVTFPAAAPFARIGRVTASGLALRLGFDIGRVENLRLAVDLAVRALEGPGTITLDAHWGPDRLTVRLETPTGVTSADPVVDELRALVDEASATSTGFELVLG